MGYGPGRACLDDLKDYTHIHDYTHVATSGKATARNFEARRSALLPSVVRIAVAGNRHRSVGELLIRRRGP